MQGDKCRCSGKDDVDEGEKNTQTISKPRRTEHSTMILESNDKCDELWWVGCAMIDVLCCDVMKENHVMR